MTAQKGLLIIYTGNGKGKTTAALGAAVRAGIRGMKTLFVQFLKKDGESAEQHIPGELGERICVLPCGMGFVFKTTDVAPHVKAAGDGWLLMQDKLKKEHYDVLVLDEIAAAINLKLLELENVISFLETRDARLHVIMTGRDMPQKLIEAADTVTEMKEIKHAYNAGIPAAAGIDY
ncbi:MAG TPA: cob(I)yrinic acid a,c-diamide adenosyltransferase [Syntrophorhabdaceae bacterium]|nr:cob(I)yrinic acid a,c-diamide adenosyltransferase [Syntrophorhabdaceae bacterium]